MSKVGPWIVGSFKDVNAALRDHEKAFENLTFGDNFESFEIQVTIPAGTEVTARNEFGFRAIPSRYLITEEVGDGSVRKGNAAWSHETVSFRNPGGSSVTARIRLFK